MVIPPSSTSGTGNAANTHVNLAALHLPLALLAALALTALVLSIRRSIAARLVVKEYPRQAQDKPTAPELKMAFASAELPTMSSKTKDVMPSSFTPSPRPRPPCTSNLEISTSRLLNGSTAVPRQYQYCRPASMAQIIMVRHVRWFLSLASFFSCVVRHAGKP
ncbi:hypothetical protein FB45DRAFT_943264 [Roridomyces roridus]|uniref:Uncharacterized protein n=1 Tax=Roridomyces roridus TaxID=1738132 RepID=A0AAD7B3X8_9AGAR|nr:hypothetical protein FB45DRAFT_943264 [Roridomyces roridus]